MKKQFSDMKVKVYEPTLNEKLAFAVVLALILISAIK